MTIPKTNRRKGGSWIVGLTCGWMMSNEISSPDAFFPEYLRNRKFCCRAFMFSLKLAVLESIAMLRRNGRLWQDPSGVSEWFRFRLLLRPVIRFNRSVVSTGSGRRSGISVRCR